MKFPLSEIADRWTILRLKVERLPEDNTLVEIFAVFTTELENQIALLEPKKQERVIELLAELYLHNASIWDLESDLRNGRIDEVKDLEEIGRRAIQIRNNNKLRLSVKNKIALLVAQKYGLDIKIDHASE